MWVNEDDIGAEKSLDKYCDVDSNLNSSYDSKFLRAIIKAYKEGNSNNFQDEIYKLSSRMTLDKTKERMLELILDKIKNKGGNALEEDYNPL